VADVFFPAWGVPDSAWRYLFIAAVACFPGALIFSWHYDITSQGIVRTPATDGSEVVDLKLKRTDYFILVALFAIGFAIVFGSASKIQQEVDSAPAETTGSAWLENSIAVLPFTNLDINQDTAHFSDGVTEEILYRLSSLGAVHVLASNSSFAFRDSRESPTEIREKLGVQYLLQGSIRREADHVRIMARLINEVGFQVWSESFDRKLEGIFAIQTEIASSVVGQIINEIVPLQELPAGRTTRNMEAYNEYLAGKAFFDSRVHGWRPQATAAFRKAIELDPEFAPPYAGLAMATTVMTDLGDHWKEGRRLAEKAIEIDPELAEGHAALGMMLMAEGELQESSLASRRALELNASMGFAYNILAITLERLGQTEEALAVRYKGIAVDPLYPPLVANVAAFESRRGNFDRAEQLMLRLLSIPKPPQLALGELYELYEQWGRFPDAVAFAKRIVRTYAQSGNKWGLPQLAWAYGNLGMTDDADFWMNRLHEDGELDLSMLDFTFNLLRTRNRDSELGRKVQELVDGIVFQLGKQDPWDLGRFGLVNIYRGNYQKGAEQLDLGLRVIQVYPDQLEPASDIDVNMLPAGRQDIVFTMHWLAFAYQQLDRHDEAEFILQKLDNAFSMETNAMHYALKGDSAAALQSLRAADKNDWKKYYGPGKYYEIINDPVWAETIKEPGFKAYLAGMKEELERQRALVEAADAEHDFRAELESLMPD
jgi:TolB-like protein/tetratricopeptide (TPR) repeat protein